MEVGFLLLGNAPFYKTGYGTQLKILGDQLIKEGYPVGHVVDFGYAGHIMEWEGRTIYPADKLPGTLTSSTMKNHIDELQKNILKGGDWVFNIKYCGLIL